MNYGVIVFLIVIIFGIGIALGTILTEAWVKKSIKVDGKFKIDQDIYYLEKFEK